MDTCDTYGGMIGPVEIVRCNGDGRLAREDCLVVEEPLEIRVNGNSLAVTMRTPSCDSFLALGFLVSEGILRTINDVYDILVCADPDHPDLRNIIDIIVNPDLVRDAPESGRQRYATSSCGLCGRATIESVRQCAPPFDWLSTVRRETLLSLSERIRAQQVAFERTGGLHAAAQFDLDGNLLNIAEDIGRHNAVDKVVGCALSEGTTNEETILMVSGRAGFKIVQKAAAARIPVVCSISAPSSLSVQLAREMNMIFAGFLAATR